jgi:hypothetical protein
MIRQGHRAGGERGTASPDSPGWLPIALGATRPKRNVLGLVPTYSAWPGTDGPGHVRRQAVGGALVSLIPSGGTRRRPHFRRVGAGLEYLYPAGGSETAFPDALVHRNRRRLVALQPHARAVNQDSQANWCRLEERIGSKGLWIGRPGGRRRVFCSQCGLTKTAAHVVIGKQVYAMLGVEGR